MQCEMRHIFECHFLRQTSFISEQILISPPVFISQPSFITTNKVSHNGKLNSNAMRISFAPSLCTRGPRFIVFFLARYLAERERERERGDLCGRPWCDGMGRGCLVIVCVLGIPNRRVAGSDNSRSAHTLSKSACIAWQGKRNMLPSQTKHHDCNRLLVDTRCAVDVMETWLFCFSLFKYTHKDLQAMIYFIIHSTCRFYFRDSFFFIFLHSNQNPPNLQQREAVNPDI